MGIYEYAGVVRPHQCARMDDMGSISNIVCMKDTCTMRMVYLFIYTQCDTRDDEYLYPARMG